MVPSLWIYRPFIKWLNGTGLLLLRLLGAPPHGHRHIHSPDEIELLIAESRDGGLLEPDEHRRLQRALRLNLRQAKQLMVPRTQDRGARHQHAAATRSSPSSRRVPTRGCPSTATRSTTSSASLHTKDLVRWLVSGGQHGDADDADPPDHQRARERDRRSRAAPPARAPLAPGAGRRRVRRHGRVC